MTRYARDVTLEIRHAQPSDYGRVIGRVNAWWGGRDMAPMLPKLFFVHFEGTSYVVDDEDGQLAGFLIGFLSQTDPTEAYVHFMGVAPEHRGEGLGRALYERFFDRRSRERADGRPCRHVTRERAVGRRSTRRSGSRSTTWSRTTTGQARIACCSSAASRRTTARSASVLTRR